MKISSSVFWMIICSILVLLNIYSIYQRNEIKKSYSEELNALKSDFELNNQTLLSQLRYQFYNEGIVIDKEIELVPDYNEDETIELKELVQNERVLVLNFSEITCRSCIESEIEKIKRISKVIGPENVIILSSYERNSDLLIFKRLNRLTLPIYNRRDKNLGLQLDESKASIFILDSTSFKTELFFIPDKDTTKLSDEYYSIVKKYFYPRTKVHLRNAVWGNFSFSCGTGVRCVKGQL